MNGFPDTFSSYFHIDSNDGSVRQIRVLDPNELTKQFNITIKAEEVSVKKHFSTATLIIDVLSEDKKPPILTSSAYVGFVPEESPVGTTVSTLINATQPLQIIIRDADSVMFLFIE